MPFRHSNVAVPNCSNDAFQGKLIIMRDHSDKDYDASLKRIFSATKVIIAILLTSAIFYLFRISAGVSRILIAIACLIVVINLPDLINILYLSRKHDDK